MWLGMGRSSTVPVKLLVEGIEKEGGREEERGWRVGRGGNERREKKRKRKERRKKRRKIKNKGKEKEKGEVGLGRVVSA